MCSWTLALLLTIILLTARNHQLCLFHLPKQTKASKELGSFGLDNQREERIHSLGLYLAYVALCEWLQGGHLYDNTYYFGNSMACQVHQVVLLLIVGHNFFLEPTLILIMKINTGHINFPPTLNSLWEYFILFCATFVQN